MKFYDVDPRHEKSILESYRQTFPDLILRHYKVLMPFMLFVLLFFCVTDVVVREMPELLWVRMPAILLNLVLLLAAFAPLKGYRGWIGIVNNLYAVSLLYMGMGLVDAFYDKPIFQQGITAFIMLAVGGHFFVKGLKSILWVYLIPFVFGIAYMVFVLSPDVDRLQDFLNAIVMYVGVIAVSLLAERSRFKEFYLKMRLSEQKERSEALFRETSVQNIELLKLNHSLDEALKNLKKSNVTKDKLFSLIAHDLRYPFNSLIGYSRLVVDEGGDFSKQEMVDFHRQMLQVSESTYKLLENLLQWSMAQTGTLRLKPENCELGQMVREVLFNSDMMANPKGISFDLDIRPGLFVFIDKEAFSSVLRNIVSNAIKFSVPNSMVQILAVPNHQYVALKVVDKGIGIAPEKLAMLTDTMAVESTEGTLKERGTGLGIILSSELIRQCGGFIEFKSEVGKGTTVILTIPKR